MSDETQNRGRFECPSFEISSYIDGELESDRELEFEIHLSGCAVCSRELNDQKQFLRSLNMSLKHESEIELPPNFARTVITRAESSVAGLRRSHELFSAVFICLALGLFVLVAISADAAGFLDTAFGVAEKAVAVASFFGHIAYSVLMGISVLLRSLSSQTQVPYFVSVIAVILSCVLFVVLSRRFLRFPRT